MIDEMIARLKAETSSFVTIAHAYTMTPVDDIRAETPAIYLYPGEEAAQASEFDNATVQRQTKRASMFIIGSVSAIESLKAESRAALLGWQPNQNYDPLELLSGKPEEIKGSHIWWSESYLSATYLRG